MFNSLRKGIWPPMKLILPIIGISDGKLFFKLYFETN